MRVIFMINDLREENRPLQPWLTFDRVGSWLSSRGHDVHFVTDAGKAPQTLGDMPVHVVPSLRNAGQDAIEEILNNISPDWVVTTVTPLNLATTHWFGSGRGRWAAFTSYAFYRRRELYRALWRIRLRHVAPYLRHLVVPRRIWGHAIHGRFSLVVSQSGRTACRIRASAPNTGAARTLAIPAGINKSLWKLTDEPRDLRHAPFLYVGSTRAIRGFGVLLDALCRSAHEGVRLRVLARSASDEEIERLLGDVRRRGLEDAVEFRGGWIDAVELAEEVRLARAVILPFVLVPSELPVSVIEAIAVGTPVVVTDIDGLPDAAGDAGMVVRQADATSLATAMLRLWKDDELCESLRANAVRAAGTVCSWEEVAERWLQAFEETAS